MNYKQCLMTKGSFFSTAWIPEKFAIIGKSIKIKILDKWEEGWNVKEVYDHAEDEKTVKIRSRDFTKQREASDI